MSAIAGVLAGAGVLTFALFPLAIPMLLLTVAAAAPLALVGLATALAVAIVVGTGEPGESTREPPAQPSHGERGRARMSQSGRWAGGGRSDDEGAAQVAATPKPNPAPSGGVAVQAPGRHPETGRRTR